MYWDLSLRFKFACVHHGMHGRLAASLLSIGPMTDVNSVVSVDKPVIDGLMPTIGAKPFRKSGSNQA